jgi:hypothetical protein
MNVEVWVTVDAFLRSNIQDAFSSLLRHHTDARHTNRGTNLTIEVHTSRPDDLSLQAYFNLTHAGGTEGEDAVLLCALAINHAFFSDVDPIFV